MSNRDAILGALIVSLTLLMCAAIFGLQIASVMDAIDRQTAAIAQMKKGAGCHRPSNRPDGGNYDEGMIVDTYIQTKQSRQALRMVEATRASATRIGLITGAPGTGKTALSRHLAEQPGCVRVCCYAAMSRPGLVGLVARALGLEHVGAYDSVLLSCRDEIARRVAAEPVLPTLVIDEANHLSWRLLETLRILADEDGAALILVGTDILTTTLRDGRTATYLAQLSSRIGAKQVRLANLGDLRAATAYQITPQFGPVDKPLAQRWQRITGGNWRLASELADACRRVMAAAELTTLTDAVLDAAQRDMAGLSGEEAA